MTSTGRSLFLLTCLLAAANSAAEHPMEFLHGTWEGTGQTSGMASSIRYTFAPALGGRYTSLQLDNQMSAADGREFRFEGVGYYLPDTESSDQAMVGVWLDSSGDIHPLRATLENGLLTVLWGSEDTEQGRSLYRLLEDGTLESKDAFLADDGEWREFSHTILSRTSHDLGSE